MPLDEAAIRSVITALGGKLASFRKSKLPKIEDIGKRCEAIVDATHRLGESWSGSWAGYHARLYYKRFQRPSLKDSFNVEWGGLRGIADGWAERSPEEVKEAIEQLSGQSLDQVQTAITDARRSLEDFRTDVVVSVSVLRDVAVLDKELVLVADLERHTLGLTRADFVAKSRPGQIVSRDSRAVYQGIFLPAHIFYEAIGMEGATLAEAADEIVRLVDRFIRQAEPRVAAHLSVMKKTEQSATSRKVFLVHGHDTGTKEKVARFLEKLDLEPVILHEQPDGGRTIIEKFEAYSDVPYAVILLTPDDVGSSVEAPGELRPRPRQNVVLELGYFIGRLGRKHVAALRTADVEIPSDLSGVLYIDLGEADWQIKLARELRNSGLDVNMNKVV